MQKNTNQQNEALIIRLAQQVHGDKISEERQQSEVANERATITEESTILDEEQDAMFFM